MKKLALLMVTVIVAALLVTLASAASDFIAVDFRAKGACKDVASTAANNISTKEYVDGGYELTSENGDPTLTISLKKAYRFAAKDYPAVRVDFKVISGTPTTGQLFFTADTDGFTMGDAGTYTSLPIDITNMDWQSAVVDMELIPGSQWADNIKLVRYDPCVEPDVTISVRFIGFFANEKDALAFDYDKWASENPVQVSADGEAVTTAPADTAPADGAAAPADTTPADGAAAPADTTPADGAAAPAPVTADPFTVTAAIMALSAGAALVIKKRR